MIEQYFQSLLDLLASLPFVESPDVNLEKRGELVGFIRGEVQFTDGSTLFFRELIDLRLPLQKIMYAYHYQTADDLLVFRYDNTAHHRTVPTFPIHKHLRGGDVTSSDIPSLGQVLREIEEIVLRSSE
ncbi:hypothetical protein FBQ81_16480 [Chloroflexi bacterium CFX6]|nr:hypothetical protein [Chloroflexi bacterium CFX6]